MLQNIRVLTTSVVWGGFHFCSCMCCKSCFYQLYFYFPLEINIQLSHIIRSLCSFFFKFLYELLISLKKKEKLLVIWCLCVVPLIVLFRYADLVFPGFFPFLFGIVHLI